MGDGGDLDTSVAREARIRSEYLEWCKKYDKTNDEARFQIFSENFLQLEEYSKENDVPMKLNKYADLTEDEYMELMNPGAKVKESPAPAPVPKIEPVSEPAPAPKATIDVSIPYDSAARLAYDEWRGKYGKGDFDAKKYEFFKQNYEAVVVANVKSAKDRRDGKDAPPTMELDKVADTKIAKAPSAKSVPKKKGPGFLTSLFDSTSLTDEEVLSRQEEVKKRKEGLAKQQADEAKAIADERRKRQAEQDKGAEKARLEAEAMGIAAEKERAEKEAKQIALRRENDLKAAEMERQKAAEFEAKQAELQKKAELNRQRVADSLKATKKAPPAPKPKVEAKVEPQKVEPPKVEPPKPKVAPPKPAPVAKKEASKPDFFSSLFKNDAKSAAPKKKVEATAVKTPPPPVVPEKPPVKETLTNIEVSDPVTDVFSSFFGSSKPKAKAKSAPVAKAPVPTPKPAPVAKAPTPAPKSPPKPAFSFFSTPSKKAPEAKKEPVVVKETTAPTPSPKKAAFSFFGTPELKKPEPKIEVPPPAPVAPKKETFSFFSPAKPKAVAPPTPEPTPAPVKKAPTPMFSFGAPAKKAVSPTPAPTPAPVPAKKPAPLFSFGTQRIPGAKVDPPKPAAPAPAPAKKPAPFFSFGTQRIPGAKVDPPKPAATPIRSSPTLSLGQSKKPAAAPAIPSISGFVQNADGSITGRVMGSKSFPNGTEITTSPVRRGAKAGMVVTTSSGSKYLLK